MVMLGKNLTEINHLQQTSWFVAASVIWNIRNRRHRRMFQFTKWKLPSQTLDFVTQIFPQSF